MSSRLATECRSTPTPRSQARPNNRSAGRSRSLAGLDPDRPVVPDRPLRVVRDLPHVAIRIGKGTGCAAPVGVSGRSHDGAARPLGLSKDRVNLLWRADVVSQLDPRGAVTTERGPQAEDHPAGLEEADVVVRLLRAAPAELLVERPCARQVGDAESHETDALLHARRIADTGPESLLTCAYADGVESGHITGGRPWVESATLRSPRTIRSGRRSFTRRLSDGSSRTGAGHSPICSPPLVTRTRSA